MAQAPVAQALMADPGTAGEPVAGDDSDEGEGEGAGSTAPRRTKEERVAARAAKAARQASKAGKAEHSVAAVPESDPVSVSVADPATGGRKPQGLTGARGGVPDKLQTIEGIGPALEKLCHELGIYHFDQIAGWGEAEIAWMDGNLKGFKGRVTRDKWVRQAALIGEVGVEEFLRRAKSNDY
jgi:NADH-quinone oxidoreductase subunit E